MRSIFLLALLLSSGLFSYHASAAPADELYIKKGDSFVKVSARDATIAKLNDAKTPVYQCSERRLTEKLKFKSITSD
jgi:hypothetical protein